MRLYFCADLGTSSLKAALIDSGGSRHSFVRIPFTNGESAQSWLDAFYNAAEQIAAEFVSDNKPLCPVSALVISGNGPTLVPVQGNVPGQTKPLRPIFWYDPAPPIKTCTSLFLPKLKNFLDSGAEACSSIKYFFSPQEWLSWKLGAKPVTTLPHSAYIPYFWNDDQCNRLGINMNVLPPFVTMGTITGEVSPSAFTAESPAAKLLPPGLPIVAGAADFIMAIIGTGTLAHGKACDRTGSSEGLNLCVNNVPEAVRNNVKQGGALRILPHAISGMWNLGLVIPKSGILFEELESRQAAFETAGRAFTEALDHLESFGYSIKELTLSGGQCVDAEWNQYKAGISGRVLKIPEIVHAELAGDAVLCEAAFSGKSIAETAAKMVRIKETFVPNTGNRG